MFGVKNEIKGSEVVKMFKKAFGEFSMSTPRVYEWSKRFLEGREDVDDNIRTGILAHQFLMKMCQKSRKLCVPIVESL